MSSNQPTSSTAGKLFGDVSGIMRKPAGGWATDAPLIVAIHGGTYSSRYFDVAGFSLLDRAEANGVPILALDRPGYGTTPAMSAAEGTIIGQAQYLARALKEGWRRHGSGTQGIVLVAHSIGAAIAMAIASAADHLPLLGLAISGVGLRTPVEHRPMWNALPDTLHVDIAAEIKDQVMFGPPTSFTADMVAASHQADVQATRAELVDIVSTWQDNVAEIAARIRIPVHYRQAEFDRLWIVDQSEVDGFAKALANSSRVDAELMRGTGHCMDFHRIGKALHTQQIGFALQCASEAAYA